MKDDVLKEARRLHNLGFAIIWLHERDKQPVGSGWTSGPRKEWAQLKSEYKPGYNVGVRTGAPSKLEGGYYLACIDVDVKDEKYRSAAIAALRELIGDKKLPTVISGGGNGSRHLYCVTKAPFKMITVAKEAVAVPGKKRPKTLWEICVYSDGRQMVLPPSIHPSGRAYMWKRPIEDAGSFELMEFGGALDNALEELKNANTIKDTPPTEEGRFNVQWDRGADIRWMPEVSTSLRNLIEKGIWKKHKVVDRSAYLLPAASLLFQAGLTRDTVLTILTDTSTYLGACAFDHAKTKDRARAAKWLWNYTVKRAFEERPRAKEVFKPASEYNKETLEGKLSSFDTETQAEEIARSWKQKLTRSKGTEDEPGRVHDTLNNLDLILSNAVPQPLFQKNEFTNRENYAQDAPWGPKRGADLGDIDVVLIKSWLANSQWRIEPKKQNIEDVMALLSHRHRTHPVRDWLRGLKWDGKPRVKTWIRDYLDGRAEEPYLSDVSKKFLLAMVTRVFQPGCQWDYTLILEGKQGTRKSTAARILAGDAWFCDHLPDLKDKDAMLNLQGSWLVELGELKNVKHADAATVKAYLTRRIDRVRAPYGKRWVDAPRQSVFIGTVNEQEYFKDPTGNRRFWPVAVGKCNVEGLRKIREQLFAEAMALYNEGGEKLYLKGASLKQALSAQDDRRVDDDESEMRGALLEYMEKPREERTINLGRFKMKELFESAGAPWGKWIGKGYAYQNGSQVLRNLEFFRTAINGQRVWHRKNAKYGSRRGAEVVDLEDFY